MAPKLPREQFDKLVSICGMLSSEFEGERASAALLATRILQAQKLTWSELLRQCVIDTPPPRGKAPPRQPPPRSASSEATRINAEFCYEMQDYLTEWEKEFIRDVQGFRTFSEKQETVITRCADKIRRTTGFRP